MLMDVNGRCAQTLTELKLMGFESQLMTVGDIYLKCPGLQVYNCQVAIRSYFIHVELLLLHLVTFKIDDH